MTLPPFLVRPLTALANWALTRIIRRVTEPPKPENPLTYKDVAHIQRQIDAGPRPKGRD